MVRLSKYFFFFVKKVFDDVPRVPLFQPTLDIDSQKMASQKNVSGYRYCFIGNWIIALVESLIVIPADIPKGRPSRRLFLVANGNRSFA